MRRRWLKGLGLVFALSIVAAACGDDDDNEGGDDAATEDTGGGTEGGDFVEGFTAGQVTDTGGVDDRSFNQTAFEGLEEASEEVGFEPQVLESESEADFAPNIQTLIDQDNDLIITVGFL